MSYFNKTRNTVTQTWSLTGNRRHDNALRVIFGLLVIANVVASPGIDQGSFALELIIILDMVYLFAIITLWAHHLWKLFRGRQ